MSKEASKEIGKCLDGVMAAVQSAEHNQTNGDDVSKSVLALADSIKALAPEFDAEAFLIGGMEAAFDSIVGELEGRLG